MVYLKTDKMKKEFTKGKWAWQLFGDTYSLTAQHGMREIIVGAIEHPEMEYPVVGMNNDGLLRVVDKVHPNAKLIAAAPEMYKQLISTYLDIQIQCRKDWSIAPVVDSIRANLRNTICNVFDIDCEELQCKIESLAYGVLNNEIQYEQAIEKAMNLNI